MKYLNLLLLILICSSCASMVSTDKTDDGVSYDWDALADETYFRWGTKRLQTLTDVPLAQCYQHKISEGLNQFKQRYSSKSQEPFYWLHVGNCYFQDKKWNKAEFFYRFSLDQAKTNTIKSIALNNLAMLQFQWGQWEKGRDNLKESIKLAPKFKVPKYNLAQLHIQFGLYENAIELLRSSVFEGMKDVDLYYSLANAYLFKGDLDQAKYYFELIPKNNFKRADIAATYAIYLIKTGDIGQAKEVIENRSATSNPRVTNIIKKLENAINKKEK